MATLYISISFESTPERPFVKTHSFTPAQNIIDTNIQPTFNTTHTNLTPNTVTSRTLSRPPIPTVATNPLHYFQTSLNTPTTQNSVYPSTHNTQTKTSAITLQNNNVSAPQGSSITANPYFTSITQVPTLHIIIIKQHIHLLSP